MPLYEVIVGNVGRIYEGHAHHEALKHYDDAVWRSKEHMGRMAGESVYLMTDGHLDTEYQGPADDEPQSPDESTS